MSSQINQSMISEANKEIQWMFLNAIGYGSEIVLITIKYIFSLFPQMRNDLTLHLFIIHLISIYCIVILFQALLYVP